MTERYHLSCMTLQDMYRRDVVHTTFVPMSYADVPSLWRTWQEEDAAALELKTKKLLSQSSGSVGHLVRHGSLSNLTAPAAEESSSNLRQLLEQQKRRNVEASVYDEINAQRRMKHIKLLGRTQVFCEDALEDLLAETRALTQGR